jgi:hypothetical protein
MEKILTTADCVYVCGDSWTQGSELIDPTSSIQNHFDPVHDTYRATNHWPKLVADRLGIERIDGSLAGASNDFILRSTIYDVSRLIMEGRKPFVIVAWTQLHRFELGRQNHMWRSFVSPEDPDNPKVATEVWQEWSSDRTDVVKWIQQIICLDSFLKLNAVDYLSTTVFNKTYRLYEQHALSDRGYFDPYLYQLRKHVNFPRHALHISLQTYLDQHLDVAYGPGGHPLIQGHQLIAEHFYNKITQHYQFKNTQA